MSVKIRFWFVGLPSRVVVACRLVVGGSVSPLDPS